MEIYYNGKIYLNDGKGTAADAMIVKNGMVYETAGVTARSKPSKALEIP